MKKSREIVVIAVIARDRKSKTFETRRNGGNGGREIGSLHGRVIGKSKAKS
jgi:uncharacterized protein YqgC (DUF456 family)